jgi:hypothetical protein
MLRVLVMPAVTLSQVASREAATLAEKEKPRTFTTGA